MVLLWLGFAGLGCFLLVGFGQVFFPPNALVDVCKSEDYNLYKGDYLPRPTSEIKLCIQEYLGPLNEVTCEYFTKAIQ